MGLDMIRLSEIGWLTAWIGQRNMNWSNWSLFKAVWQDCRVCCSLKAVDSLNELDLNHKSMNHNTLLHTWQLFFKPLRGKHCGTYTQAQKHIHSTYHFSNFSFPLPSSILANTLAARICLMCQDILPTHTHFMRQHFIAMNAFCLVEVIHLE